MASRDAMYACGGRGSIEPCLGQTPLGPVPLTPPAKPSFLPTPPASPGVWEERGERRLGQEEEWRRGGRRRGVEAQMLAEPAS